MTSLVSVPGRTEVAGNHQDHQGGCVIASAIDRRIFCEAEEAADTMIYVESEGHAPFMLDMAEPDFALPHNDELYSTKALVRGMAAQLVELGACLRGCKLRFHSEIPAGSGLSSSAAFELCAGAALLAVAGYGLPEGSESFCSPSGCEVSILQLTQMALHAERTYFGKPAGIMDQTACAYGGVIHMDFKDREDPVVTRIELPGNWSEWCYFIVDCGSSHEDTTKDFARLALDMQAAADHLGIAELRDISMDEYLDKIGCVRRELGDLVALRAFHFYNEFDLVEQRKEALEQADMELFVRLTDRSGVSSAEYLQNVGIPCEHEEAMVALAMCRIALAEAASSQGDPCGCARIHGGGFGGTIQVIVPKRNAARFKQRAEELLGSGCCTEVMLGAPGIQVL